MSERRQQKDRRQGARRADERLAATIKQTRQQVRFMQVPLLRRTAVGAIIILAVVAVIAAISLAIQEHRDSVALSRATVALRRANHAVSSAFKTQQTQTSLIAQQQQLIVQGCLRLNVKQREDNRNQFADYIYDREFIALVRGMHQKKASQRRLTRQFLAPLIRAARVKAWVPPVSDCSVVSATWKAPAPIPFSVRFPPKSAL